MDDISFTWRVDSFDGHVTPTIGRARDGIISVGTVSTNPHANAADGEDWWWSCTATGRGVTGTGPRNLNTGTAPTKEGAKAAVEACYRELLASDPDVRALLWAHAEQLRRSADMWAGRIPRGT